MKKILFSLIFIACLPIYNYGQIDGNFACHRPLSLAECSKIPNPQFRELNTSIINDDFYHNNIPGWYDSHGTSDVNRPNSVSGPFVGANPATMGVGFVYSPIEDQAMNEGIAAKIVALQAGKTYIFSMFVTGGSLNSSTIAHNVRLNVALINCQNFIDPVFNYNVLPLTNPNQVIFCETYNSLPTILPPWKQIVIRFTAQQNYNMLRIYPEQTVFPANSEIGLVHIAYPELVEVTDFSAGIVEFENNCDFTITANNCGVKNAVYTWRDPLNNIVQQGSSQQFNGSLNNNPAGTYSLSMSVPTATSTNNSCNTENNPVVTASVNVAGNCNCTGGLEVYNPTFDYEWDNELPISLTSCEINRMCNMQLNGDDIYYFTGTSYPTNGNIWQVRQYPDPLYPSTEGMEVNNILIPYPQSHSFTTYSTSANGAFTLFTFSSNAVNFEIRLINTITNTSRLFTIKVVSGSGPGQNQFYCVQGPSSVCPIPHKLIYGENGAGYSYLWTLPTLPQPGMIACSPLTNAWVTWDDANFDYQSDPNPIAKVNINNVFGCPASETNININPNNCIVIGRNSPTVDARQIIPNSNLESDIRKETVIAPNPIDNTFKILAYKKIKYATIFNVQGIALKQINKPQVQQPINIADLKPGTYFIKISYNEKEYEVKSIIKL